MQKNISIIIVNYRSRRRLKECLDSVYTRLPDREFKEVFLVNNDAGEEIDDLAANYPGLILIDHKKNIGFGAANNLAAEKSSGELLFFLNPDAELLSCDLEKITEEFQKNPRLGIVGARLLDGDSGKTQPWAAGKKINLWDLLLNNAGFPRSRKIWESRGKQPADWVSGSALFIRRKLFRKLGGFDENIFMYFEDADLCRRAKKENQEVFYLPEIIVRHWGGGSSRDKKEQKKHFYRSQDYYFEKHCGKWQSRSVRLLRKIFFH